MLWFEAQSVLCTFMLSFGVTEVSFVCFLLNEPQLLHWKVQTLNFIPLPSTTSLLGGKTTVIDLLHLLLFQPGAFPVELPPALQRGTGILVRSEANLGLKSKQETTSAATWAGHW